MRWGNFKEASAWSEVHGHATRHTKSTVTTCLFSFLLIGLSDFFYACSYRALRGQLRPTCLFCLPQTTFHTADSRRRLFPQNLDSRAEDNNPTTPTAPASGPSVLTPPRHTMVLQSTKTQNENQKNRHLPYHKEFLVQF